MTETARIIAYLRREADKLRGRFADEGEGIILSAMEQAFRMAADHIERGEHLKKPEPSILARDWKDVPSAGH